MSTNDITGDEIKSKPTTQAYRDNYDLIFGNKTYGSWSEFSSDLTHHLEENNTPQSIEDDVNNPQNNHHSVLKTRIS
jgi:hypothetical protein